ncbi:hypothetical protein like AT3G11810 [Hibiscus trionum]|uniref:Transmembrane protein n=1 Tax=Hibiscus trionum TaxID=183268 RepID=A0A9W7I1V5_HIBTR|nr:hypothetical protein like AT3G11810 [Hibiscus trionum]
MAAPPSPPSNIGLWTILSESRRILRAQPPLFQTLLLLFLLPFSLLLSLFPFVYKLFSPTPESHLSFFSPIKPLIFNLIYSLIMSVFSNFAGGSIIYSIFHGFYGQPVKPSSAIKAAFTSFFPLIATSLVQSLILSGINLIIGLVFFALFIATQIIGFQVDYSSASLVLLCLAYVLIFMFVLFYLQVNWMFAYVIVVVESSWGLEPLKRSQVLVKGSKGVALKILLFFGLLSSINVWLSIAKSGDSAGDEWKSWSFFWNILGTTALYTVIMVYNLAAYTVFYIYSKALHGELAEEFAGEYVRLPFDDGKVPHVDSIV